MELPNNIGINKYAIKLIKDKQPLYRPIYSLGSIELETIKAYIKIHLKTVFIRQSKSFMGALILFDKKLDDSLCLCINYQNLNNLIVKNWYPLFFIDKSLDRLGHAKQFT